VLDLPDGKTESDAIVINQHHLFSDDVVERLRGMMLGVGGLV